jgi:hypothetical protein
MLIIKVKRNVENHPEQGKQWASTSTYTQHEGVVVIDIFDA